MIKLLQISYPVAVDGAAAADSYVVGSGGSLLGSYHSSAVGSPLLSFRNILPQSPLRPTRTSSVDAFLVSILSPQCDDEWLIFEPSGAVRKKAIAYRKICTLQADRATSLITPPVMPRLLRNRRLKIIVLKRSSLVQRWYKMSHQSIYSSLVRVRRGG